MIHFVKCMRKGSKPEHLKITRIFDLSLFYYCKVSNAFCLEGRNKKQQRKKSLVQSSHVLCFYLFFSSHGLSLDIKFCLLLKKDPYVPY